MLSLPEHVVEVLRHGRRDLPVRPRRPRHVARPCKGGGLFHHALEVDVAVVAVARAAVPLPGGRLCLVHRREPVVVVGGGAAAGAPCRLLLVLVLVLVLVLFPLFPGRVGRGGAAARAPGKPLGKGIVPGHLDCKELAQVWLAGAVEHLFDRQRRPLGLADHLRRVVLDMQQDCDDVLALSLVRVGAVAVVPAVAAPVLP